MATHPDIMLSSSYGGSTPAKNRARAYLTLREGALWRALGQIPQGLALMIAGTAGDVPGLLHYHHWDPRRIVGIDTDAAAVALWQQQFPTTTVRCGSFYQEVLRMTQAPTSPAIALVRLDLCNRPGPAEIAALRCLRPCLVPGAIISCTFLRHGRRRGRAGEMLHRRAVVESRRHHTTFDINLGVLSLLREELGADCMEVLDLRYRSLDPERPQARGSDMGTVAVQYLPTNLRTTAWRKMRTSSSTRVRIPSMRDWDDLLSYVEQRLCAKRGLDLDTACAVANLTREQYRRLHRPPRPTSVPQVMPPPKLEPRPEDQRPQLDALVKYFAAGGELAHFEMRCGGGKTLEAFWLARDLHVQRVLYFAPQLSLLRQVLQEWDGQIGYYQKHLDVMVICSDPTVGKVQRAELQAEIATLRQQFPGYPVETEAGTAAGRKRVRHWLQQPVATDALRVLVSTYPSGYVTRRCVKHAPVFDLLVGDEAHTIAGPKGKVAQVAVGPLPVRQRVFMTGTRRIISSRIKARDPEVYLDMACVPGQPPGVFGPDLTVPQAKLAYAIEHGLAPRYKIYLVYPAETETDVQTELVRLQACVARNDVVVHRAPGDAPEVANEKFTAHTALTAAAIRQLYRQFASPRNHTFAFSNKLQHCESLKRATDLLTDDLQLRTCVISGAMLVDRRQQVLERTLQRGARSVVFSCRAISTGFNSKLVDTIIWHDRVRSPIDLLQQIGRALRLDPDNPTKEIALVLPVLTKRGQSVTEALQGDGYRQVARVIDAACSMDETLAAEVKEWTKLTASQRQWTAPSSRIVVVGDGDPVRLQEFRDAVYLRLYETQSWHVSLADCQRIAKERGGRCLSSAYINSRTYMEWECAKGHRWNAPARTVVKAHHWCRSCVIPVITLEHCQRIARERGGRCLSSAYINSRTKMKWECAKGHRWSTTYTLIRGGSWCPKCLGHREEPFTLAYCQRKAHKHGGRCLSVEYNNSTKVKMRWECAKGHRWSSVFQNILKGFWCPICDGRRITLADCHRTAHKHGGRCLPLVYNERGRVVDATDRAPTPMKWECAKGHRWLAPPSRIRNGNWCPRCTADRRTTLEDCQQMAQKHGGRCLSSACINSRTKMKWECARGHRWQAPPCRIRDGHWCPKCANNAKVTLTDCQRAARKQGGKCISSAYLGTKTRWECAKGHRWSASFYGISRSWCPKCVARSGRRPAHDVRRCKVRGCFQLHLARGFCRNHYRQMMWHIGR